MLLSNVLDNIDYKLISGDPNKEITSVEYDSRKVAVGSLFVCVQGFTVDGHTFASKACEKDAQFPGNGRCILVKQGSRKWTYVYEKSCGMCCNA